jgi:hypothetical protein
MIGAIRSRSPRRVLPRRPRPSPIPRARSRLAAQALLSRAPRPPPPAPTRSSRLLRHARQDRTRRTSRLTVQHHELPPRHPRRELPCPTTIAKSGIHRTATKESSRPQSASRTTPAGRTLKRRMGRKMSCGPPLTGSPLQGVREYSRSLRPYCPGVGGKGIFSGM